jgi:O-antigen/teichoic acid export membrane protein
MEINRYYNGLTAVTILLVVASVFAMPLVLQGLIGFFNKPEYLDILKWIPYIAITYLLRAIRLYTAMPYNVTKYAKPLPLFYTLIAVTKIAAMVLLIPRYGIHGVLFSTWLSYVVEVLILYFGIKNRFEIRFNVFKLVIAPLAIAVIIGLVEPVFGGTHREVVHASYIVIAGILLLWAFRNELKIFNWNFFAKMR